MITERFSKRIVEKIKQEEVTDSIPKQTTEEVRKAIAETFATRIDLRSFRRNRQKITKELPQIFFLISNGAPKNILKHFTKLIANSIFDTVRQFPKELAKKFPRNNAEG